MLDRKSFLGLLVSGGWGWPKLLERFRLDLGPPGTATDQDYWDVVRQQFLIPADRIYLNNGTLGPSPHVVVRAVEEHARRVAETFPPGIQWDDLKGALARVLGGDPEGYVVSRNTTEAMNFVANGLEIGPGDEVLTTDHEHIGGLCPWQLVAARRGASLRTFSLPVPASSEDALYRAVVEALTPITRVLTLSHVTFTTGTILPVRRIAALCRERGIVCVVDGAHPPGMLQTDLGAIGADFYASSPHKWLLAPQGTGFLYLGERFRTSLWPTLASGGWDDASLAAHRLNHMGTVDESRMAGLMAALEFHSAIGSDLVEERVRYLAQRLRLGLMTIPGVQLASSTQEQLAAPMISFSIEGIDSLELQSELAASDRVRSRVIGEYDYGWMRLSTHIYNSPSEVDRVLELINAASRRR